MVGDQQADDTQGGETNRDSAPEWLPEEYDPEDSLYERLPLMAEIDGGIELHAKGDRGVVEVVGEPHELTENAQGTYRLKAGGSFTNWNYEVVVPEDHPARLETVDPDQDVEAYFDSRTTYMKNIDVRIFGVDAVRLKEAAEA